MLRETLRNFQFYAHAFWIKNTFVRFMDRFKSSETPSRLACLEFVNMLVTVLVRMLLAINARIRCKRQSFWAFRQSGYIRISRSRDGRLSPLFLKISLKFCRNVWSTLKNSVVIFTFFALPVKPVVFIFGILRSICITFPISIFNRYGAIHLSLVTWERPNKTRPIN